MQKLYETIFVTNRSSPGWRGLKIQRELLLIEPALANGLVDEGTLTSLIETAAYQLIRGEISMPIELLMAVFYLLPDTTPDPLDTQAYNLSQPIMNYTAEHLTKPRNQWQLRGAILNRQSLLHEAAVGATRLMLELGNIESIRPIRDLYGIKFMVDMLGSDYRRYFE